MDMNKLTVVTDKMDDPFERLHHICLMYVNNEINRLTLIALISALFLRGPHQWMAGNSLDRFAKRITQRG